jgi:hypothetical protein
MLPFDDVHPQQFPFLAVHLLKEVQSRPLCRTRLRKVIILKGPVRRLRKPVIDLRNDMGLELGRREPQEPTNGPVFRLFR